jgi:hypothetical protein
MRFAADMSVFVLIAVVTLVDGPTVTHVHSRPLTLRGTMRSRVLVDEHFTLLGPVGREHHEICRRSAVVLAVEVADTTRQHAQQLDRHDRDVFEDRSEVALIDHE